MIKEVLNLILITLIPGLELRASIPYGYFGTNLNVFIVFLLAVLVNILLGGLLFFILNEVLIFLSKLNLLKRFFSYYKKNVDKRIRRMGLLWREIILMIFIAIPLPGSGVYSGAIAGEILELDFKKYLLSMSIGVIIAGIIIFALCHFGKYSFLMFTSN